jgi:hypothetical protein
MPSTFTPSLRLTLPATGENAGTWGLLVNTGITELVDSAIAGRATISTWGGAGVAYTLSNTDGAANEARQMFITASGSPGEAKNVICPAVTKMYVFTNATTGGFALTLKTPAGSGVVVPNGKTMFLRCDGTDVLEGVNYQATMNINALTLNTALGVASGGTGSTTLTANNVLLGNGTSALQAVAPGTLNNVLYSNGTTWVSGPIPSAGAVTSFSAGTTGFTPSTGSTGAITLAGTLSVANGGTGQTTYTDGQLLIGNTTGNTLAKATLTAGTGISITNGSGTITIANTASGTPTLNVVTGTTQAAATSNHYVLTNVAATTLTLPATPSAGDLVWVTVGNGLTTNVVARNGSNIQSLAEDLTLNSAYAAVQMRYINSTIGWTFV